MDDIKIGLDFGTHQTKICICKTPDEGHGLPEYEFMKFVDLQGIDQFFIPSVVQVNKDDTLSYGYVDPNNAKTSMKRPTLKWTPGICEIDVENKAIDLCEKYSKDGKYDQNDIESMEKMLRLKTSIDKENYEKNKKIAQDEYEQALENYHQGKNVFRYFKQAMFAEYPWEGKYEPSMLCIWYLSYILFIIEERFGDQFQINLGVPTDDTTYQQKKETGVQLLVSAFYLVEVVYHNDLKTFLNEKVDQLEKKTKLFEYSDEDKDDYNIKVFPEAYASLIGLTSRGKLSEGMSINVDIGGGTTDISFFVINNGKPKIYKYWSILRGLNYIAEYSGFDYSEGDFSSKANIDVIRNYNKKKELLVYELIQELLKQLRANSRITKSNLRRALEDRIIVYNGGGSIYPAIATPILYFSDVKTVDSNLWTDEIMQDKTTVKKLANLLTTSFGLSVPDDDEDIEMSDFNSIFSSYQKDNSYEKEAIDKDVC